VRAAVSVCAGIAGGYFSFELFYMVGVAWELHRFPDTNLAGLMELIAAIAVGVICGLIILIAMWIWMEPEGRASIGARGLLAASLGVLAAPISFIVVNERTSVATTERAEVSTAFWWGARRRLHLKTMRHRWIALAWPGAALAWGAAAPFGRARLWIVLHQALNGRVGDRGPAEACRPAVLPTSKRIPATA